MLEHCRSYWRIKLESKSWENKRVQESLYALPPKWDPNLESLVGNTTNCSHTGEKQNNSTYRTPPTLIFSCVLFSPPPHLFASILCAWQVFKSLPCQTTTAIKITFCKLKNGHQRYLSSLHNVNNYLLFAMIKYKHPVMRGYLDKNHKV